MSAGSRDQRITIQKPVTSQSDYGNEEITGWTDNQSRWARAEVQSGREYREAQATQGEEKVTFYVERDTEVQRNWRIKWGTNRDGSDIFWDVESAPDPRRRNERMIHCRALVE